MNVAVAGLGFMGATHLSAWRKVSGARIAAVMSSDGKKLSGNLTAVSGNLGGRGERFDFSGVATYRNLNDLLQDGTIDAVDICLPTDLHETGAVAALKAGKHVLLEKPMALGFEGAERISDAARHSGKVLMVGHVLRFIPAYQRASSWVASAGRVYSAAFRRRCAAPAWSAWLGDKTRSGGGVFDLLIHDADFCISLWGMPDEVRAVGYEDPERGVDIVHARLTYRGMGPVTVAGGWHHFGSYPFSMDYTIVAEAGVTEWSSADAVQPEESDPFVDELRYFSECVRTGRPPLLCPTGQSAQAVKLMRIMLESRERNGEPVRTF